MSQNKPKTNPAKRKQNWIPLAAALGGVLLIVLAFMALRGNSSPRAQIEVTGAPALKADQEKVDLGDVQVNQIVEASFQLTNVGDQTLQFSRAPYIEVVEGC